MSEGQAKAPKASRTLLAARATTPEGHKAVRRGHDMNHSEIFALQILKAMQDPATYRMVPGPNGGQVLSMALPFPTNEGTNLYNALAAIGKACATLEHALLTRKSDSFTIHTALHQTRVDEYIIYGDFPELTDLKHASLAADYITQHENELKQLIRKALFPEAARYIH